MQDRFNTFIGTLVSPSQKILLAVSGGLDSTVLLDLAAKANLNFSVAHVNFELRGEDSNGDECFVKELAEQYGAAFFVTRFDTLTFAKKHGISKQMAARQLRYQWFAEIMRKEKIDFLMTAHHLNDNIETSLLNFVRGTGISGMRGMPVQSNHLIRPLLLFRKEELEFYAKSKNLKWREDVSNSNSDYHRNFLRHEVIPKLKEINPSLENTFLHNATRFNAEEELVKFAHQYLSTQYVSQNNNQVIISKKVIGQFHNKAGVLWELIKEYGFNVDQCELVMDSIFGQSGKQFHTNEFTLTIDRESFIITKQSIENQLIEIKENDTSIELNNCEITLTETQNVAFSSSPLEAYLDRDCLKFPLLIRTWKNGDLFYPLGMDKKKKVSNFLIDEKISVPDKNKVLVMESENNICWVVGYRMDDRFKITNQTKSILHLKIKYRIR